MTINSNHIYIKCPDGFCNQLRLTLAANILVKNNLCTKAFQQWILNNHNVVSFNDFFEPLNYINFTNDMSETSNIITTQSFRNLIKNYWHDTNINISEIFRDAYKDIILKKHISSLIDNFITHNRIQECIGVHVRTGCKTSLLQQDATRHQPLHHDKVINILKSRKEQIFLATDNKETQDKFIRIFGDRMIVAEKIEVGKEKFCNPVYDRRYVERFTSPMHVVSDFIILQYCKYFIGSNESSLSLMVSYIRNNNLDYPIKGIL